MKILRVILFTDADVFAGTERHILDLALSLRNRGVGIKIACPTPSPLASKASAEGLDVVPIQKRRLVDWQAIFMLCRLLKFGKADIIHAHNGRTALLASLALIGAKRGRFVMTQHFIEPAHNALKGPRASLHRLLHGWVNRRINHFIAISEAARQQMLERCDAPADKISVIQNGIPTPDYPALTTPNKIREGLEIKAHSPLIVCVARLEREKDIASLIAAMRKVAVTESMAICVIAGEGSEKDTLSKLIKKGGMAGNVRLLGFRADALSLINACDILVLPSLAEPFGLVLLEAMALGKPVIATGAGGPLEIVVDGETGLLVPPSNPDALSKAILDLLKEPQKREGMGRKGQELFLEKYTAERMADATIVVYEKVIQEPD